MLADATKNAAKPPLIRDSTNHLTNSDLQRMYANGYYRPTTDIGELENSSGWIATNYAYLKFDQLAYRLRHFWSWKAILAFVAILFVIIALIVLSLSNQQSPEKTPTFGRFIPLNDLKKRTLADFKLRRPLLSIDTNNNLLILSSPENLTDELFIEQLALDSYQDGFSYENVKLYGGMRNCQQLSSLVHCCVVTETDDTPVDKGTHCFRQRPNGLFDHYYEKETRMILTWQTLGTDETVLLLQNRVDEYSVFDTKHGSSMPIMEDEGNAHLLPVAYFFTMDNAKELTELAEGEYNFHACEYLRDSGHRFLLHECTKTRFCANPIYQAVLQFDDVFTNTRWQLQITYIDANDDNIYTVDSVDFVPNQQIAINCLPSCIDIYMVSDGVLVHYAVDLPKSDGESLIGNYF